MRLEAIVLNSAKLEITWGKKGISLTSVSLLTADRYVDIISISLEREEYVLLPYFTVRKLGLQEVKMKGPSSTKE